MVHESDSLSSQLVEAQGTADHTIRPVPPEDLPRLLKLRQQLIDAGRISKEEAAMIEHAPTDQPKN